MLKPDGTIGVVDFYVSQKYPPRGMKRHSWWTRTLWPTWFAFDNVFLSQDHLPFLLSQFKREHLTETSHSVPFVSFIKVPHYVYIGKNKEEK